MIFSGMQAVRGVSVISVLSREMLIHSANLLTLFHIYLTD